ncbi:MAG: ribbon-helix-helix domain-containing protein [Thermoplasmataceae archaeon]|jgi:metal-responsive CopG/Arc/MetJ family transcriptional regulator|nr:ribbon-helix-helix domain-containing protein [Candidatus Thermoplasmatota archaeon]
MDQDEKITIRISKESLAEIDEFLESRQDLGTRSEFIRSACLRYIQQSRMGQDSKNGKVCVKLRGLSEKWLEKSVSLGLYSDLEDAVSSIITEFESDGSFARVIERKLEKFREAEHVFDKYESIVNDDRKSFQIREYKKE